MTGANELVVPNLRGGKAASSVRFDYSSMPPDIADEAKGIVAEAIDIHGRQIAAMLSVGDRLGAVKNRLDHGLFMDWIEAEFPLGYRTALNYMTAAAAFEPAKRKLISYLPPALVYQVASPSTPEAFRQALLSRQEPILLIETADIKGELTEARAKAKNEAKQARIDAKLAPRQKRDRRSRAERIRQEEERRIVRIRAQKKIQEEATVELVQFLKDALGNRFTEFIRLFEGVDAYRLREMIKTNN